MKYSLLSNIGYVYKESFDKYPRIKLYLIINFITELLVPFLAVVTTTLIVYALTSNSSISFYLIVIGGVIIITYILETIRAWSLTRYTFENTFARIAVFTKRISEHQFKTDYMNVESKERRNIISKAYEAIGSNYHGIEMALRQTPLLCINFVGIIVYGALISINVPLVLVVMIIMTFINYLLTKRANAYLASKNTDLSDEFREKYYLTKDATNPNYGKDIRLYNIGNWFHQLALQLTKRRIYVMRGIEKKFLFADLSNTMFLLIRDFIAYVMLLTLVINQTIDLTSFTFYIGIVIGFSMWLNGFTTALNEVRTSSVMVSNYRNCITTNNEIDQVGKRSIEELKHPLTIEFDKVSFYYPGSDKPTIENLSFTIKGNEKIALVGNNGAGKTTIIKLLCGLYRPSSGTIKIGGYDILDFNVDEYMSTLSVVFQDSEPFAFTVEDNISCLDNEVVDKEKLWDAIRKSGLEEKVKSLDKKEKTFITQTFDENGIRLSGGETQKMMLARSIYKNAPILILDEPTAALDPLAEEEMYLKYKEMITDSTTIFISHRLSSTKFCDRILLLEQGQIIEEGTHETLMNKCGEYKEMFEIQAKYYKEGEEDERN